MCELLLFAMCEPLLYYHALINNFAGRYAMLEARQTCQTSSDANARGVIAACLPSAGSSTITDAIVVGLSTITGEIAAGSHSGTLGSTTSIPSLSGS